MLSQKSRYALRALLVLAARNETEPMQISDIAQVAGVPRKFLEQILLSLKGLGLVASKKGKGGGYSLAQPPHQITLASVIRMMEGPLAPLPCASETRFRKCDECVDVETCGTRMVMREVRDAVAEILERTTLATVCRKVDLAQQKKRGPEAQLYEI